VNDKKEPLERVHTPVYKTKSSRRYCAECGVSWPCSAAQRLVAESIRKTGKVPEESAWWYINSQDREEKL